MMEQGQFWRNKDLRKHAAVVDGEIPPTIVFQNSTYLNVFLKKWVQANIWIYEDRIVYVGDKMPANTDGTEVLECTGQYMVPGYIEPHAHPFQLYNPETFAYHGGKTGTTTLINDNIRFLSLLDRESAFELINDFHQLPVSMFWWGRFDSQSMLRDDDQVFNTSNILSWLSNPSVVQGGELTAWPKLLRGDDRLLYWIQEAKKAHKRVEGHFPGSSKETLTKLKLFGVSGDHESMTAEELLRRLEMGYHTAIRHSSIRPDLPKILEELLQDDFHAFDLLMYTTDGSSPSFYEQGNINQCIDLAIKSGVPLEEAYRMASYNVSSYYGMDNLIGSIAPGQLAHINILYEKDDPHPLGVLAKGEWLVKDGKNLSYDSRINWEKYEMHPAKIDWELNEDDLQFSIPIGLKMENDVIMKPYAVDIDITTEWLSDDNHDAFLLFMDRYGKWRVNTVINGFTQKLGALCSSFSTTDDIILIGKDKTDMRVAFERMRAIGGGIVLAHEGEIIYEIPLSLQGAMYKGNMEDLIEEEKRCKKLLVEAGYRFHDPIYNLLFLSSTHLPYVRVTQVGIVDVMKHEVIVPANMR